MTDNDTHQLGHWLITERHRLDLGETDWLLALADFDHHHGWADDGALSCTNWLIGYCHLARSTANDKVRTARQLAARPGLTEALQSGAISYSAARAITRAADPDPDIDRALIDLARAGTVADVERAVRTYQAYADQDRPPDDRYDRRYLRLTDNHDGTGDLHGTTTAAELHELRQAIQAFLDPSAASTNRRLQLKQTTRLTNHPPDRTRRLQLKPRRPSSRPWSTPCSPWPTPPSATSTTRPPPPTTTT